MNNNYGDIRYNQNDSSYRKQTQKNNDKKKDQKDIEKHPINEPLALYYADKKKAFLEDGVAYKIAVSMGDIAPHQLRKILNQVKEAVTIVKKDEHRFEEARNKLYYMVPLTAYNTGRNKNLKILYNFVCEHVNENSITTKEDIIVLDQLFTSIIAYHKLKSKKEDK